MDQNRRLAYLILKEIQDDGAYSNLAVNSKLSGSGADQGFVRELVYGVLRNALLLDFNIERFLRSPKLKSGDRTLLRMGFYQLCFMNSVSDYAAVSETVSVAASFMKGREGFINAVLRNFTRSGKNLEYPDRKDLVRHLSVRYSCHESIVKLFLEAYGEELTEQILCQSNRPAALSLRPNPLKSVAFEKTAAMETSSAITASDEYRSGIFSIQGAYSQEAVRRLNPQPGERLIDLCAAPGGKSCAAAELMNNEGEVLSFDFYPRRVALISREARRLGIDIIRTGQADATAFMPELAGSADRVICDVPCSGLGTISKKPEIKLKGLLPEQAELPDKQLAILKNGAAYLKKGGTLLYSTCTVNPAENGGVVNRFLKENPGFALVSEEQFFPSESNSEGFYIAIIKENR